MYTERKDLYKTLESERDSKLLSYVTGDRRGLEAQIHPEVLDHFVHHLDLIGITKRITLFLYTQGGDTLASWSIVNLIRQFCEELEVVVPAKAQSGGTLICLGADNIIMTKQAMLGPIDPSVNGPLNPQIAGAGPKTRVPVSVEAINGYIEFTKTTLGKNKKNNMDNVLDQLASQVHPLVLGNAYRSRAQIRMLARRLVTRHLSDEKKIEKVLNFLCSESGSHDYTIFRREAREELGLQIENPDQRGYELIKQIYDNIAGELELTIPYNPVLLLGQKPSSPYKLHRALIESVTGGCHVFLSQGNLNRRQLPSPQADIMQMAIEDDRTFEGWHHEP